MGHISIYTISNIIIVVGVIWAISGFFQYLQVVKMNNILYRLGTKAPRVFRGINGKFFALRMYVLAASDAEGKILDASYLYTSILLKPSKEIKADQLIGQYIPTIDVTKLQQDKKVYRAVCNLQEDYRKRCNLNAGRKATAFMSKSRKRIANVRFTV